MGIYQVMQAPGAQLLVQRIYIIGHSEIADSMATPHAHDCLEIVYVGCPLCRFHQDGKAYLLHQDDFVVYDSSLPHRIEWVEKAVRPLLGLAVACTRQANDRSLSCAEMLRTSPGVRDFLAQFSGLQILHGARSLLPTLQGLVSEMLGGGNTGYETILLNRLFIDAANLHQSKQSPARQYVEKICAYIEENFAAIEGVDEIAAVLGLNRSHIQRVFRAQTGRTIWQYLQAVRMRHAEALLSASDLSIGEIGTAVGLHSRQNFHALFRKTFGLSPREYRSRALI